MSEGAPGAIDFYFEFSSPYGYIASQLAEDAEKRIGRPMKWRPFLLGPVFKLTGGQPLVDTPMKGSYSKRDFPRDARRLGQRAIDSRYSVFSALTRSTRITWLDVSAT